MDGRWSALQKLQKEDLIKRLCSEADVQVKGSMELYKTNLTPFTPQF